ncbi:OmpA family protein [Pseudomonas sp. SWRI153]|uniref:OmpA family protein n=1 Tax=Pseudomonas khorasanensis TaxID=2745508 RepID=A0A923F4Z8_9PSED|nr:OmpA family protein [Pseudomonas khorasanensis]MBV4487230.1 OmpA family protein [Pseudomonas khorasanensis]
MTTSKLLPVASVLAALLAGCATPQENPQLIQARAQFAALQNKPESNTMAALETRSAFAALNAADQASLTDREAPQVDQLAYLASQKIALAEQTIAGRQAEAGLKKIDAERTQVQLDVRTRQLKALQAMKARQTDRGQVVTFGDVLFDTGKADLKYGSQRQFQQLADFLNDNPERKVRVEGFTDDVGSDDANQVLSERRAASVAVALTKLGVDRSRILTQGYGEEYAVADNGNAAGRQHNRRVEVIVSNGADTVGIRR